jgi:hypothetical protein
MWGPAERTGFVSAVAGVVGVGVAVLAWLLPMYDKPPTNTAASPNAPVTTDPGGPTGPSSPSPSPSGPPPSPSGPPLRHLDTIQAETGADKLGRLPRALIGDAGYDHPVVIKCPSNQTGDKSRQVTYPLRGRYLTFTATVRPHFTRREDQDAQTRVYVRVSTRQPDGTMNTVEQGRQPGATTTRPAPLTADVERGDLLTLVVECEVPDGIVVLTNAGLTPPP